MHGFIKLDVCLMLITLHQTIQCEKQNLRLLVFDLLVGLACTLAALMQPVRGRRASFRLTKEKAGDGFIMESDAEDVGELHRPVG